MAKNKSVLPNKPTDYTKWTKEDRRAQMQMLVSVINSVESSNNEIGSRLMAFIALILAASSLLFSGTPPQWYITILIGVVFLLAFYSAYNKNIKYILKNKKEIEWFKNELIKVRKVHFRYLDK